MGPNMKKIIYEKYSTIIKDYSKSGEPLYPDRGDIYNAAVEATAWAISKVHNYLILDLAWIEEEMAGSLLEENNGEEN